MAKLEFNQDLSVFGNFSSDEAIEEVACKMINEALPIVKNRLENKYSGLGEGKLAKSLKIVKAKKTKSGGFLGHVVPKGSTGHSYRKGSSSYPLSFAGLAVFLEYGTVNNRAHGILGAAIAETENECTEKMQEVFNREVGTND